MFLVKKGNVSTHSRPKAAACPCASARHYGFVSTHSRPKAAASLAIFHCRQWLTVSTHSRPKAAAKSLWLLLGKLYCFNTQPPEGGCKIQSKLPRCVHCFNTQPPEGGCKSNHYLSPENAVFQHTAARRRLRIARCAASAPIVVSTHSRPKAAAMRNREQLAAG